jgi:phosphotransacetylase
VDAKVPGRNENKKVLQKVGIVRGCRGVFEPESKRSEKKRKGERNTIGKIVTPCQSKRSQETRWTARRKRRGVGSERNERTLKNEKRYAALL